MKHQINALNVRHNINWSIEIPVIAYAKVYLPEMATLIDGVMLAYRREDGVFLAFPPAKKSFNEGIKWDAESEWPRVLADDLSRVYLSMGGDDPQTVAAAA